LRFRCLANHKMSTAAADAATLRKVLANPALLAAVEAAAKRQRKTSAGAALGNMLIDVLPIAFETGHALDLSQFRGLCAATWRKGDKGATSDVMLCELHLQVPHIVRWRHMPWGAPRPPLRPRSDSSFVLVPDSALNKFIRETNEIRIRTLIAVGAPLNSVGTSELPPLLLACRLAAACTGESRALAQGYYVNRHAPALLDPTAAELAAALRIVKMLLDGKYEGRGADVNQRGAGNRTALMDVCAEDGENNLKLVKMLLSRGAKQDLLDFGGATALHAAAQAGSARIIAALHGHPGAVGAFRIAARSWDRSHGDRTPLGVAVGAAIEALRGFDVTS